MDLDIQTKSKVGDLQILRSKVSEALTYQDTKLATEAQIELEDILASKGLEKELFGELTLMLAQVKFIRFTSLTDREVEDLVENYLP
ncbi:MAG: hypothetical protein Q7K28_03590, partial [Candidatus Wildermuthbacteria bacterium]|nr:hypothetical protein [Candidatus Wildermuthbacteria bacterium]